MNHEENDLGIDRMIEKSTASEVPPDVEASLRTQLADFRTRIEHSRPVRIESLVMGIRLSLGRYRNGIIGLAGAAVVVTAAVLFLNPGGSGEVYAAAAHRLQQAKTLSYSIVLNTNPYVAVDFTHQAPGFQRLKCSWGLEVKADSVAGKTLILFHYSKQYLFGTEAEAKQIVKSADEAFAQFRSLPERADEELGEKGENGKTFVGFRVRDNDGITDIWVDRASGQPDHVDITILESGKSVHQMKIDNIRLEDQAKIEGMDLEPPSEVRKIPETLVAVADIVGPWGGDSSGRWGAFLGSVIEQGYAPAGPAQETWLGVEGTGDEPRTEMKIAVTKAQ